MNTVLTYLLLGVIGTLAFFWERRNLQEKGALKKKISQMLLEELNQHHYRG